ncbi:hypothetical protein Jann_0586 [Jannaschia sp. CCS1]|nr:hypothetical protein Jann_0586 [Jannaschia sp. CCS1]
MLDANTAQNPALLTVGYEGTDLRRFLACLEQSGVKTLVDVRERAQSRKKGFSKTALAEALAGIGIRYVHLRDLGDPKPGRDAARAGDYETFRKVFTSHMDTDAAKSALSELDTLAKEDRTCILCFERCHTECHRAIVATYLKELSPYDVVHVEV